MAGRKSPAVAKERGRGVPGRLGSPGGMGSGGYEESRTGRAHPRRAWRTLAAAVLGWVFLFSSARAGQGDEGWYRDVSPAHWAYHYIRVLWEEEVTDGWRSGGGSVFLPDRDITRAEFTLMAA